MTATFDPEFGVDQSVIASDTSTHIQQLNLQLEKFAQEQQLKLEQLGRAGLAEVSCQIKLDVVLLHHDDNHHAAGGCPQGA